MNQWDSPPCVEPLRGDAAACHWPAINRSADNPIELGGLPAPSQFLWMGGAIDKAFTYFNSLITSGHRPVDAVIVSFT